MVFGALCGLLAAFWLGYVVRGTRELDAHLKATLEGVRA